MIDRILSHAVYDDETGQKVKAAVIRCDCGRKLDLWDSWSNECDCGREYNSSGQLLAPRSEWGWETGEQGDFG